MSLWKIASASMHDAATRATTALTPKRSTQDSGLPLGGRIGGYAKVDEAAIFTATVLGSFVIAPSIGEAKITAISRVRLDGWPDEMGMFRYYLAKGDDGDKERFIQVVTRNGVVSEVVYFTSLTRLYPDSVDGLRYYSGELGDEGIGGTEWVFTRDDLKGLLTDAQFNDLPADKAEIAWNRAVGSGDHVLPVRGMENRIDDAVGDMGLRQELYIMPHERVLEGGLVEHLLVSLEVVKSHNGEPEKDVHVDFMIGIPLAVSAGFQII